MTDKPKTAAAHNAGLTGAYQAFDAHHVVVNARRQPSDKELVDIFVKYFIADLSYMEACIKELHEKYVIVRR